MFLLLLMLSMSTIYHPSNSGIMSTLAAAGITSDKPTTAGHEKAAYDSTHQSSEGKVDKINQLVMLLSWLLRD